MATYLTALPSAPPMRHWSAKVDPHWGMMLNDQLGDCTCAAAAHLIQSWTANETKEQTLSDQAVLAAYKAVGGYNPSDPTTDQGAVELDVLNYWRNTGVGGVKIDAFVALEPRNHDHVRAAIDMFGGAYIGLALPISAQNQRVWSVPPSGTASRTPGEVGSWGGHAVVALDYDWRGVTCVTWGELKLMTWRFWDSYCEEGYALLCSLWTASGRSPSGFRYDTLKADLAAL